MKIKRLNSLLAMPLSLGVGITSALAAPLPGGTLDPTTIPKYVTPLVIPPVMHDNGTPGHYDIAMRQFKQQILPGGIWATLNPAITNPLPATTVWSYGPNADPTPAVAPAANSQFNYPAFTVENTVNTPTSVNWINGLVDANGNALSHLFPIDQTLHWANPLAECLGGQLRTDCKGTSTLPWQGPVPIVPHVHGAHVSADSDGYTEAWWLPSANDIHCVPRDPVTHAPTTMPRGQLADGTWEVVCAGSLANRLTDRAGNVNANVDTTTGSAAYLYQNDQPSTTLWFHDHALGFTRLNVYAGPAGFWLIRDPAGASRETGLGAGMILPGPAPVAGQGVLDLNTPGNPVRNSIREIPIVIQGRSFNADGSLFYPGQTHQI